MSQGSRSDIVAYQDFLHLIDPGAEVVIADAASNYDFSPFTITAAGGEMGMTSVIDEPGGVVAIQTTGGDNEGPVFSGPVFSLADGPLAFEARFKVDDISLSYIWVGFQETLDLDDYDTSGVAAEFSGTALTTANQGQVVGVYFDADATVDGFRMILSNDGVEPASIVTVAAANVQNGNTVDTGGMLALNSNGPAVTTLDDSWIIIRVEVDQDGAVRGYVGNEGNDVPGTGPKLIAEFGRGPGPFANVRLTQSMLTPILYFEERSGVARIVEVDYLLATGQRDWAV